MKCSKAKRLASPHLDGELGSGLKQSVESHIANCGKCSIEFDEAMKLRELIAQTERFKAPYGFATRVMANANAGKAARRAWMPIFAKFAETIVILVMVAVGIISGSFLINELAPKNNSMTSSFSLEMFEPAPPGSIGGAYLAMMETGHEK